MSAPLIGITCNVLKEIPDTTKVGIGVPGQGWQLLADDYVRAVSEAGGVPLLLPIYGGAERAEEIAEELLECVDGILLSGGNDVSPACYGESVGEHCGALCPERDEVELAMARYAVDNDIPLLGICRGMQVLNVALGGTLYQNIHTSAFGTHTVLENPRNVPAHDVVIEHSSPLFKILGKERVAVNSFHHQAIKNLATGLSIAAVADGGIIEAVYLERGRKFVLATQWHPEMMYDDGLQKAIFAAFVTASYNVLR